MGSLINQANDEAEQFAERAAQWMKENRPWNDRTGEAREGLGAAVVSKAPPEIIVVLYHTAEHGIFLENGTVKMAPLPIIGPAMRELPGEFMSGLEGIW